MKRSVILTHEGREGRVIYDEGLRSIAGYHELGGGDVVAILSMGSIDQWRSLHPWAVGQRTQILRYIAAEVIRQQSPSGSAEIDEASGDILLRSSGNTARTVAPANANAAWVLRFGELKARVGLIVLLVSLVVGAAFWLKDRLVNPQPGADPTVQQGAGR